jgi:hypothetical protein
MAALALRLWLTITGAAYSIEGHRGIARVNRSTNSVRQQLYRPFQREFGNLNSERSI